MHPVGVSFAVQGVCCGEVGVERDEEYTAGSGRALMAWEGELGL